MDPKNFDLAELKRWLKNIATQEDKTYEFKAQLPHSKDQKGKNRLKKEFCSFANCRDGYFFFGVSDDKKAVGVSNDKEFQTKLSQIVQSNISPSTIEWELCNVIRVNRLKSIFVVKVKESLYFNKPHIFFQESEGLAIPIRKNGHLECIKDGRDLRGLFLHESYFYLEYGKHIRSILGEIKMTPSNPEMSLLKIKLFQAYKDYLRKLLPVTPDKELIAEALVELDKIENAITQCTRAITVSSTSANSDFSNFKADLNSLIDNFLLKFEKII